MLARLGYKFILLLPYFLTLGTSVPLPTLGGVGANTIILDVSQIPRKFWKPSEGCLGKLLCFNDHEELKSNRRINKAGVYVKVLDFKEAYTD